MKKRLSNINSNDIFMKGGTMPVTLVSMKDLLRKAKEGNYAVGQYNINNLEFAQAFFTSR
ncbi:hypothetical protein GCM10020331_085210 [Ectobacillus funiculus]